MFKYKIISQQPLDIYAQEKMCKLMLRNKLPCVFLVRLFSSGYSLFTVKKALLFSIYKSLSQKA